MRRGNFAFHSLLNVKGHILNWENFSKIFQDGHCRNLNYLPVSLSNSSFLKQAPEVRFQENILIRAGLSGMTWHRHPRTREEHTPIYPPTMMNTTNTSIKTQSTYQQYQS